MHSRTRALQYGSKILSKCWKLFEYYAEEVECRGSVLRFLPVPMSTRPVMYYGTCPNTASDFLPHMEVKPVIEWIWNSPTNLRTFSHSTSEVNGIFKPPSKWNFRLSFFNRCI